jgi:hypothetical protein
MLISYGPIFMVLFLWSYFYGPIFIFIKIGKIGKIGDRVMDKDYAKWFITRAILKKIAPSIIDKKSHVHVILEMWIINSGGLFLENPDWADLRRLMEHYKKSDEFEGWREIIQFMALNFEHIQRPHYEWTEEGSQRDDKGKNITKFGYGLYETEIKTSRVNLLRKQNKNIYPLIMRYAILEVRGSNQWAVPSLVYKNMIKKYNIEIEGFASPFNSRMLKLRGAGSYCSMFPDTDRPFGSLGSFFSLNTAGKRIFMNPPFVPEIIEKINKKIAAECKKSLFILCVPEWPAASCYTAIFKNKFLKFSHVFGRGKHYYKSHTAKITATFNTTFFLFSDGPAENHLAELYNI